MTRKEMCVLKTLTENLVSLRKDIQYTLSVKNEEQEQASLLSAGIHYENCITLLLVLVNENKKKFERN